MGAKRAPALSLDPFVRLLEQSIEEQRDTRAHLDAHIEISAIRFSGLEKKLDGEHDNSRAQHLMLANDVAGLRRHVGQIEEHVGFLTAKTTEHDKRFDRIDTRLEDHDTRFDRIDARLDDHDTRFDRIDARLDDHDTRFDRIDARLEDHDTRFDRIDARLDDHDTRFDNIDTRFDNIDTRFDDIDTRFDDLDNRLGDLADAVREIRTAILPRAGGASPTP